MLAIYKKEIQSYFTSMIAYMFIAFFIAVTGIYFTYYCVGNSVTDFTGYVLPSTTIIFMFLIPIITMRLIAEEKKQRTDQLLLTSPIRVSSIVLGKYLAVLTLYAITLILLLCFPIILSFYGEVTWSTIFTGFLGYFLLGASLLALGLFISSLTENQIVSAAVTFVVIIFMYFMNNLADKLPARARYTVAIAIIAVGIIAAILYVMTKSIVPSAIIGGTGLIAIIVTYMVKSSIFDNGISKIVNWISVLDRFSNFSDGILDAASTVYYLSFIGLFVYLTVRSVEKTRWN